MINDEWNGMKINIGPKLDIRQSIEINRKIKPFQKYITEDFDQCDQMDLKENFAAPQ